MASVKADDQAEFRRLMANDPQIQAVVKRVWGNVPVNQRPSDTPKGMERANHDASEEIMRILSSKGINLPKGTFINPRTESLEGKHGWAGLPTAAKIAIIGAAAATGIGAAGALGAFGASAAPAVGGASGASAAGVTGAVGASTAAGAGLGGTAATTGGVGLGGKLVSSLLNPNTLSTIGRGIGSISGAEAHNRGSALDAMMAGDQNAINAREARGVELSSLWKQIQQANYVKNGGAKQEDHFSSLGSKIPDFGFGAKPASEDDKNAANAFLPQLMDRLNNPLKLQDYNSKINPSKTESALNWLGPLTSIFGAMRGSGQTNTVPGANAPAQPPVPPSTGGFTPMTKPPLTRPFPNYTDQYYRGKSGTN